MSDSKTLKLYLFIYLLDSVENVCSIIKNDYIYFILISFIYY